MLHVNTHVKCVFLTSLIALSWMVSLPGQAASEENDSYSFTWLDPDKKIYVVQNRKFIKENRLTIGLAGGQNFSSPFNDMTVFFPSATFFMSEQFGLRGFYLMARNTKTDLFKDAVAISQRPLVRDLTSLWAAQVLWAPFYGKLNTFNEIIYFDWIFGLGFGRSVMEVDQVSYHKKASPNEQYFANPRVVNENYTNLVGSVGLRLYLSTNFSVQMDLIGSYYKAPGTIYEEERVFSDDLWLLGVNYSF